MTPTLSSSTIRELRNQIGEANEEVSKAFQDTQRARTHEEAVRAFTHYNACVEQEHGIARELRKRGVLIAPGTVSPCQVPIPDARKWQEMRAEWDGWAAAIAARDRELLARHATPVSALPPKQGTEVSKGSSTPLVKFRCTEAEAMALAQLAKRICYRQLDELSDGDRERNHMVRAVIALQTALSEAGFNPR